jgi:CRISPR-associated protein (TIGR02710 family)
MKFLVITVGGSCAPIVTSIRQNRPDKIVFLCSDDDEVTKNKGSYISVIGAGNVCGNDWRNPDKPNITTQAELEESSFVVEKIKDFDNYNECYNISFSHLSQIRQAYPEAEIIADYTGGTKSMTAGLVMAAADVPNVVVAVVRGERTNLMKTDDGTERVSLSRSNYAYVVKQLQSIERLVGRFDYASATNILETISTTSVNIPAHLNNRIDWLFGLCKALDAWDKFDHKTAYALLNRNPYKKELKQLNCFLKMVMSSRSRIDDTFSLDDVPDFKASFPVSGFEVVHDLLFNAERRNIQERFDDAVARLYRALELFAQIHLRQGFDIQTSDIKLDLLPERFREKYATKAAEAGKIKIGLLEAYQLIAELDAEDAVGKAFTERKLKLLSALEKRNSSILAHGFSTISKSDYKVVWTEMVMQFLKPLLECKSVKSIAEITQLPQKL